MDFYSILGVSRSATPEEIKKAYRQKVKQHHPDTGGDDETFKKISEAYEILSNSDKRSAYDNPQSSFRSQHFNQNNPFNKNPFDDMFEQFGFRQQRPKNRDITLSASIDLKDVFTGKDLVVQYRLQSGKVETVTVNIPAGARHGDTVRYEELGDDGHRKFARGDLHVKIQVQNPKGWARDNNNIVTKRTVNVFDLLLGCAILIETLDGKKVKLNVPKGTLPGKILSINGYGVPDLRTGQRGHLYIQIDADIPVIDDLELLETIENLRDKTKKD